MSAADPVMLATARRARGLTQVQLASASGLSQAFISKAEAGRVALEDERLERVAAAVGYPLSLLTLRADDHATTSACAFHRKRSSLPIATARRIHASLSLARVHAEELLRDLPVSPVQLPQVAPTADGYISPVDIARRIRTELDLGEAPVKDLTSAIEAAGAITVSWDLGNRSIDAISQWPVDHRPLFLTNSTAPGDRQRFTLAHELGHAVMHRHPVEGQEQEADRFASELLLPASSSRNELESLDMPMLAALKSRWGVSMAALIRRARDLGCIGDYRYKELNIELSRAGWRTREPVDVPVERPSLLVEAISRLRAQGWSDLAIAERAHLSVDDLQVLHTTQEMT